MQDGIAARVSRLISGGFHALAEAVDDAGPDAARERAVREVDAALDEVRAQLGRVMADQHLAFKRLTEANHVHAELGEQLSAALQQRREAEAEALIARQLDLEAQIPVLEVAIQEAAQRGQEFEGFIAALLARRREMQATAKQADLAELDDSARRHRIQERLAAAKARRKGGS